MLVLNQLLRVFDNVSYRLLRGRDGQFECEYIEHFQTMEIASCPHGALICINSFEVCVQLIVNQLFEVLS